MRPQSWMTLVAAALLATASAVHADFVDPLDTPAQPSALAQHGLINGLAAAGKRLVAVGQRGHILYSDDAGASWTQAAVPVSSDLTAVHFPSASHGWAVGHDGVVLASTDGGASWVKQLDGRMLGPLMQRYYGEHPPAGMGADALKDLQANVQRFVDEGPDKPFLDVWFESESSGFVVGPFNLVFHTDDGGRSWQPWFDRTDNPKLYHFYAVRAVGGELYLAGEQGALRKLDRAAQRFRTVSVPYNGTLFGIGGTPRTLLVFGLRGTLLRSADGGATWTGIDTHLPIGLTAATVTADGRIVVVSQAGHVLISADEGRTFNPVPLRQRVPAAAVAAAAPGTLVLGGPRGLLAGKY